MQGFIFSDILLFLNYQAEAIAVNIHDLDLWIIFQVFPEFGNVNIHTSSIKIGIAAPDTFQRLFSWKQVVHMLAKHF